jgi:ABC-type transporter Mla subunit MlaD
LAESFLEHHPEGRVFLLLVEESKEYVESVCEQFTTIFVEDLELPDIDLRRSRYTLHEFSVSLKPLLLEYIFNKYDYKKVCFFDADIYIYHSLKKEVWEQLDCSPIILTPHLIQSPADYISEQELNVSRHGIYNSGFIGLSRHPDSEDFIVWWKNRLSQLCYRKPDQGMASDQRWLDFVPTLGLNVYISRDPGMNAAYWDLSNRFFEHKDGGYWVNGVPLKFFHFSKYSPDLPDVVAAGQKITFDDRPDIKPLFDSYRNRLKYFMTKQQSLEQVYQNKSKSEPIPSQLQQTQEELEQSRLQLHQTQEELKETTLVLQQTQEKLEQSDLQLHQTQEKLEQSDLQLHQTQEELEQFHLQLHQTQEELEQSDLQLHQTQEELRQTTSVLQQTQEELSQTTSVLQQTQEELGQTTSVLQQTQEELGQTTSVLQQTQEELGQTTSVLQQTQEELDQTKSVLQQTQEELGQTTSVLQQTQEELGQTTSVLRQTQEELGQTTSVLRQTQEELGQTTSVLQQTQEELGQTTSVLQQTQEELGQTRTQYQSLLNELKQSQSQLHHTQRELEQLKSEFFPTHVELVTTQVPQQYASSGSQSQQAIQYRLLVSDAWYGYQNGDLTKMAQCLQDSLKFTPFSQTETIVNWLDNFAKFSSEKGGGFDTHSLTNSQEWQQLMRRLVSVKPGMSNRLT